MVAEDISISNIAIRSDMISDLNLVIVSQAQPQVQAQLEAWLFITNNDDQAHMYNTNHQ